MTPEQFIELKRLISSSFVLTWVAMLFMFLGLLLGSKK